jgi:hypothetical protein
MFSWRAFPPLGRASRVDALFLGPHTITNTPVAPGAARVARFAPRRRPSSCFNRLGVHIARFEACSVFILIAVCVLADPASRDLLHRGLRSSPFPAFHAPTASGWSNSYRVGYPPPTGSSRPFHGALKPRAEFLQSLRDKKPSRTLLDLAAIVSSRVLNFDSERSHDFLPEQSEV